MACRLIGAKPLSEPIAGILLIGPLGTNFNELLIETQTFSFTGLPTSAELPYFVRILHAKYGSTNLAFKIRKLSSVSSVT